LGGAGFDFITIDTEYTDFQILKAITLPMLGKCRMMCIEPTNMDQRAKMKPFLQALGLTAFYETPENLIAYKP
jgi:hypothetical protein